MFCSYKLYVYLCNEINERSSIQPMNGCTNKTNDMKTKEQVERILADAGMCIDVMPDFTWYVRLANDSESIVLPYPYFMYDYLAMDMTVVIAKNDKLQALNECQEEISHLCESGRWYEEDI